jgi:hypothetical protein
MTARDDSVDRGLVVFIDVPFREGDDRLGLLKRAKAAIATELGDSGEDATSLRGSYGLYWTQCHLVSAGQGG